MLNRFSKEGLLSDDKRKIVQFEENGMTYKGINETSKRVLRYNIDGGIIAENIKKCDKALYLPDSSTVYFVELKGCNLKRAAEQIYQTLITLGASLDDCVIHGRAVCSRIQTPDVRSSQIIQLERELAKRNGSFKKSCRIFSEDI